MKISVKKLFEFEKDVFSALGAGEKDAIICAKVLNEADRCGIDTHGIGRLKPIYYDRIKKGIVKTDALFKIKETSPTGTVVDAKNGLGMSASHLAMNMAIKKAKKHGLGITFVKNSSHYGIAGYYVEIAALKGCVGITGTNARPSVAPTFAAEPLLGTNPIAIGIPTDEKFPFIADFATSQIQRGKIELYERLGKKIPQGWVIDEKGNFPSSPQKILSGLLEGKMALLPLGGKGESHAGYKGYALSTAIEIFSSAFTGGPFLKDLAGSGKPHRLGHFFIAINISHFTPIKKFKKHCGEILRELRKAKKLPGEKRIYTPWEKEYLTSLKREKTGVDVCENTVREMIQMRDELGLSPRKFNFSH